MRVPGAFRLVVSFCQTLGVAWSAIVEGASRMIISSTAGHSTMSNGACVDGHSIGGSPGAEVDELLQQGKASA